MFKTAQFLNILKWIKLFTYISATVMLLSNNSFNRLTLLIPAVILLFLINYSREYWLEAGNKPDRYIALSIILEMMLIICIGFWDKSDIEILFFFVLVSTIIIKYPFVYSIPLAAAFICSGLFIYAERNGFSNLPESILPLFFSYGVSTVFVMGMSFLVKMQMREKEKLACINIELEQAYRQLIESSAAAHQLTIEEERTRIAREIHDTLAHTLTTLIVQLEACKRLSAMDPSRLPAELEKAQELSRSGFNDVKRSIKALRPQAMEDKSFLASINSVINTAMETAKVHITLNNLLPQDEKLTTQVEIALYRAIQESITNSLRHGQAGEISVTIKQENSSLSVIIKDNGRGCASIKKGYGIKGIRERIEILNGSVELSSSQNKGFLTKITIPIEVN